MTIPDALTLILFLFPLAYSPGPGNMFFAALGAQSGLYASLRANIGYHLATLAASFAIGSGFALVVSPDSFAMMALQGIGALYVLWLASKLWRAKAGLDLGKAGHAGLLQGGLLLILNPKGYVIMALMFSQFSPQTWPQIAMISVVFTLNNMVAFLIWTIAGQTLTRLFNSPKAARRINAGLAGCLALTALWLFFV